MPLHDHPPAIPATPEARAAFIAATLGLPAPAVLVDEAGRISPEVCAFCLATGASLDFILLGDMRPMLRYAHAAAQRDHMDAAKGGCSVMPFQLQDAMNDTDWRISRSLGLANALYKLADDFPGLNNSDPVANGLLVLTDLLSGEIKAAQAAHEAEWQHMRAALESGATA